MAFPQEPPRTIPVGFVWTLSFNAEITCPLEAEETSVFHISNQYNVMNENWEKPYGRANFFPRESNCNAVTKDVLYLFPVRHQQRSRRSRMLDSL